MVDVVEVFALGLQGQGGVSYAVAVDSFSRPANTTEYAAGDLVANSATAGSVVPLELESARAPGGSGVIRRCTLKSSSPDRGGQWMKIHFWSSPPEVTNGDNGVFAPDNTDDYLGYMTVVGRTELTDGTYFAEYYDAQGAVAPAMPVVFIAKPDDTKVYALLEVRGGGFGGTGAFTPVSGETFTLQAEITRS